MDHKNCWVVNLWGGLAEGEKKTFEFKFGSKLLVTYFRCDGSDRKRIRIWKMGIPPVLIHDRICKFRNLRLVKVDERFIVLRSIKTFYFISTETFEEIQLCATTTIGITIEDCCFNCMETLVMRK